MAGTVFDQPYFAMRQLAQSGRLGDSVQIITEKSYPYYPDRAQAKTDPIDAKILLRMK